MKWVKYTIAAGLLVMLWTICLTGMYDFNADGSALTRSFAGIWLIIGVVGSALILLTLAVWMILRWIFSKM